MIPARRTTPDDIVEQPCACGEPVRMRRGAEEREQHREMSYHVHRPAHAVWSARRWIEDNVAGGACLSPSR